MGKSAAQILRNLESRIARLERQASDVYHPHDLKWVENVIDDALDSSCPIKGFRTWRQFFKSLDTAAREYIQGDLHGYRDTELAELIERSIGVRDGKTLLNKFLVNTLEDKAIDAFDANYRGELEFWEFQEDALVEDMFYETITSRKFR